MSYTEQLEELQRSVDDTLEEVQQAATENHEQLEARIDRNQHNLQAAVEKGRERLDEAGNRIDSKWEQVKADASAKAADLKVKMEQRRREHNADRAASDAEWVESDAAAALDLASWATDNARLAILDALDARTYADSLAAEAAKSQ